MTDYSLNSFWVPKEEKRMSEKERFRTDDYAILEHCWSLPPKYNSGYLDMCISFQSSVGDFLDMVNPAVPPSWRDKFSCTEISGTPLDVSYFRCSRELLVSLANWSKDIEQKTLVTFQLRTSKANKFRCCLVRVNDTGFREHQQKPSRFIYIDTLGHLVQEDKKA